MLGLPPSQKSNEQDNRPQTIHQKTRNKAHSKLVRALSLLGLQGTNVVHHHLIVNLQQILREAINEGLLIGHSLEVLRRHHDLWQVHNVVNQQPHLRPGAERIHREGGQGTEAQLPSFGAIAQVAG